MVRPSSAPGGYDAERDRTRFFSAQRRVVELYDAKSGPMRRWWYVSRNRPNEFDMILDKVD